MDVGQLADDLIRMALFEDIGRGDLTSEAVIPLDARAQARFLAKSDTRVAGIPVVTRVLAQVDPGLRCTWEVQDGEDVAPGTVLGTVTGPARSLLMAERTALNFFARLSGIANGTKRAAAELAGTRCRLLDTRKTTPGWRLLEKYAVRLGGALNHRFGLDDMVLIKDNHIAVAGSITAAVERVRAVLSPAHKVEVEVETLAQLEEALTAGADWILLDNMDLAEMQSAVEMTAGRVPLEASGNMTLQRLRAVAETGVDYISMGALTHSARAADISLDVAL
ncbi:MAG: carboxylating nicotinate-nucleotide diphosphorylase [Alicyclobacillus sp.]|nr:carboxylating nicotinate-nucleotide diphosphorylase [Alicyclobacillus sp.]